MAGKSDLMAGSAFVRLYTKDAELRRGLRNAQRSLEQFSAAMGAIGAGMVGAGAAIAAPLALSVRKFAEFQDAMAAVGAKSQATDEELAMLTEQAKLLGRTTSFTAVEIANLQHVLAQAGFKPQAIIDSTEAIQNLGRATGTELATAAEIAQATMNQFRLEATDMTRIADVLTATAMNSAQSLTDLGESMKYMGPVAAESGISMEETAKAAGLLANLGIKGSMAGTALRQTMLGFADATKKAKIEEVLGRSVDDISDLGSLMVELGQASSGMATLERLDFFRDVFGLRGMSGALGVSRSLDDYLAMSTAIDDAGGTAARVAEQMDNTLGGTFRRITSAIEGVQIAIGEQLQGAFRGIEPAVTSLLGWMTEFLERNREVIPILAGVAGGLIVLGTGFLGLALAAKGVALIVGLVSSLAIALPIIAKAAIAAGVAMGVVAAAASQLALADKVGLIDLEVLLGRLSDAAKSLGSYLAGEFTLLWGRLSETMTSAWQGISAAMLEGEWGTAAEIAMLGIEAAMAAGMVTLTRMWVDLRNAVSEIIGGMALEAIETFRALSRLGGPIGAYITGKGLDAAASAIGATMNKGRIGRHAGIGEAEKRADKAQARLDTRSGGVADASELARQRRKQEQEYADEFLAAMGATTWPDAPSAAEQREAATTIGAFGEVDPSWLMEQDDRTRAALHSRFGAVTDEEEEEEESLTPSRPFADMSGIATYSAAAAQAAGFMGAGTPEERMADGIDAVSGKLDEVVARSGVTIDRLTELVTAYQRHTASMSYGAT